MTDPTVPAQLDLFGSGETVPASNDKPSSPAVSSRPKRSTKPTTKTQAADSKDKAAMTDVPLFLHRLFPDGRLAGYRGFSTDEAEKLSFKSEHAWADIHVLLSFKGWVSNVSFHAKGTKGAGAWSTLDPAPWFETREAAIQSAARRLASYVRMFQDGPWVPDDPRSPEQLINWAETVMLSDPIPADTSAAPIPLPQLAPACKSGGTPWPLPNENGIYPDDAAEKFVFRNDRAQVTVLLLETLEGWVHSAEFEIYGKAWRQGDADYLVDSLHRITAMPTRAAALRYAAAKLCGLRPQPGKKAQDYAAIADWAKTLLNSQ